MTSGVPSDSSRGGADSRWKLATFFIAGLFLGYLIRDFRAGTAYDGKGSRPREAASDALDTQSAGPYQSVVDDVRWEAPAAEVLGRRGTNVVYRNETLQFTVRTNEGGGIRREDVEKGP